MLLLLFFVVFGGGYELTPTNFTITLLISCEKHGSSYQDKSITPKLSHREGTLIAIIPCRTVCSVQQLMENRSCLLCVVTPIVQGARNDQYIEIKTLLDSVGH